MPTQFCQTSGSGCNITQSFNQSHQICLTPHNLMITQIGRFEDLTQAAECSFSSGTKSSFSFLLFAKNRGTHD